MWLLSSENSWGFVRTSVVLEVRRPFFAVWPGIVLMHFPSQHISLKLGFLSFRLSVKISRSTADTPEMLLLKEVYSLGPRMRHFWGGLHPLLRAGCPEETGLRNCSLHQASVHVLQLLALLCSIAKSDDGEVQHCALLSSFLSISSNALQADVTMICRESPVLRKAMTKFSHEEPTLHIT